MASKLTIEKLADDGRGLARVDGKVCFVSRALPGEVVSARRTRRTAGYDEYELLAVEASAAARVAPPCTVFDRCGGCDLQHLDHAHQVDHKARVVIEHLARAMKRRPATVEPPLEGPAFGYRRRARLAIDARDRNAVRVGFRGAKSTDVVDVGHCMVLDDLLAPLPRALQGLIASLEAPRNVGHVELAVSESSDGATLVVIGVRTVDDTSAADRARWLEFAKSRGVYLQFVGESSLALQPCAEPPGYLLPNFGLRLGFEPGDFLQGNAVVNRALIARLIDWLDPQPGQRVLDAFCGLGNFALPIAARGANVVGVEGRASTVSRARQNAIDNGIDTVEFIVRNLQEAPINLPRVKFDAVVLDPPRTGALDLAHWIAHARVPTVAYVSCSPATLARDARVFAEARYRLDRVAVVDMFPQTSQIESMCLFKR